MRVLVCGSRRLPWPDVVGAALDSINAVCLGDLVVIEGCASGADRAAHDWCRFRGLGDARHRCYPVDWQAARRTRPDWRVAGHERNAHMLRERPDVVIAFHDAFDGSRGGTSDMCLRAVMAGVPTLLQTSPVWHEGERWLGLDDFPQWRRERVEREAAPNRS